MKIEVCKTISLPFVLYEYEAWPVMLRGECCLRVYKNRLLRKIVGPKREEVVESWKKIA
jgi:hypothetical protein